MFRIDEIAKQHKDLFPLADESGQINKLQEELTEYMIASNDEQKKKELADCLIVCAGIYRFSKQVGITQMMNIYGIIHKNKFSKEEVEDKATAKWLINLNRKWEFKDGSYHHIGIDGAE